MVIPMVFGLLIYLFFHKPNLLLHSYIARYITIPNYYHSISSNTVFLFLLQHVPDALWIYSLGVFFIVSFQSLKNKLIKAALIIFLGSLTEIVQIFLSDQFTYDWIDLLIIVVILLLINFNYEIKNNI